MLDKLKKKVNPLLGRKSPNPEFKQIDRWANEGGALSPEPQRESTG